jgi:hypothetical protein
MRGTVQLLLLSREQVAACAPMHKLPTSAPPSGRYLAVHRKILHHPASKSKQPQIIDECSLVDFLP